MRRIPVALLALCLAAPALSASATEPAAEPSAELAPAVVAESPPAADAAMNLTEITVEERAAARRGCARSRHRERVCRRGWRAGGRRRARD